MSPSNDPRSHSDRGDLRGVTGPPVPDRALEKTIHSFTAVEPCKPDFMGWLVGVPLHPGPLQGPFFNRLETKWGAAVYPNGTYKTYSLAYFSELGNTSRPPLDTSLILPRPGVFVFALGGEMPKRNSTVVLGGHSTSNLKTVIEEAKTHHLVAKILAQSGDNVHLRHLFICVGYTNASSRELNKIVRDLMGDAGEVYEQRAASSSSDFRSVFDTRFRSDNCVTRAIARGAVDAERTRIREGRFTAEERRINAENDEILRNLEIKRLAGLPPPRKPDWFDDLLLGMRAPKSDTSSSAARPQGQPGSPQRHFGTGSADSGSGASGIWTEGNNATGNGRGPGS